MQVLKEKQYKHTRNPRVRKVCRPLVAKKETTKQSRAEFLSPGNFFLFFTKCFHHPILLATRLGNLLVALKALFPKVSHIHGDIQYCPLLPQLQKFENLHSIVF